MAQSVHRVSEYHQRQRETGYHLTEDDGSLIGMKVAPLDRVGLYVPGGKASYPSTVVMNAVPALVAGVQEIIAVVPPQGVTDVVLAACALSGVTRVFRIGGAQAIAALAYGTKTIPRVDKIVGPGNRFVAEAKRQVVGRVGIDMIAGPTEVLIIADGTAQPERLAADMIAQAEHDEDATSWCVCTDPDIAEALPAALERALAQAPRAGIARAALERNGLIVIAASMRDAIEVANRRAPEHLQIVADGAERIASSIRNAGAIFLGDDTPEPVGDYIAGPSHVLPTSGTARYASPLGVYDFVKRTSVIRYAPARLQADAAAIIALAEAEGLYGSCGGGEDASKRGSGAEAGKRAARQIDFEHGRVQHLSRASPTMRADCTSLTANRPAAPLSRLVSSSPSPWCSWSSKRWAGGISGSLALIADAGHMLTDAGALGLSLLSGWIALRPATQNKTYGYQRWEILAALVNGAALFGIAGWVVVEAIQRIQHPQPIRGRALSHRRRRRAGGQSDQPRHPPRHQGRQPQYPRSLPPRPGRRSRIIGCARGGGDHRHDGLDPGGSDHLYRPVAAHPRWGVAASP